MRTGRICDNPKCLQVATETGSFRYGLCPSCQLALRKGLYLGGSIAGLIAGIVAMVLKLLSL